MTVGGELTSGCTVGGLEIVGDAVGMDETEGSSDTLGTLDGISVLVGMSVGAGVDVGAKVGAVVGFGVSTFPQFIYVGASLGARLQTVSMIQS